MNRRTFFNSLSAAVAGCYLAAHVRLADVVQLTSSPKSNVSNVNPEWINAPFKMLFMFIPQGSAFPMRMTADGHTVISPFIVD